MSWKIRRAHKSIAMRVMCIVASGQTTGKQVSKATESFILVRSADGL